MSIQKCRRLGRAFSLVELVCIVVIVGMMAVVAAPRFAGAWAVQRVEGAARRSTVDLNLARTTATTTNAPQTVQFNAVLHEYSILGMADPDHPGQSHRVRMSEEPYRATFDAVAIGPDMDLVFDVYGVPDEGGSIVLRVGNQTRTVTVDGVNGKAQIE